MSTPASACDASAGGNVEPSASASALPRTDAASASAVDGGRAALFETVFHDSPDGIVVVDARLGTVIECNRAVRQYLGYEPERLVGERFDTLFADTATADLALVERVRLHGAVLEERELRRVDGSCCAMRLRTAVAQWAERRVVIVTLRDVREHRRAVAERRSAEAKYRRIFEQAVEGIFQTTPDGRYVSANPALARIYGYDSADDLTVHLTDIAGQLYVDPTRRAVFRRLLEERDVVRDFESQVYRRDGTVTWISENARAVRDAAGTLRHYEGTVVDISERKRSEEARRVEAEVAHALARAGRELIASIDSPEIFDRLCDLSAEVLGCDWTTAWMWDAGQEHYVSVASGGSPPRASSSGLRVPRADFTDLLSRLDPDEVAVIDAATAGTMAPSVRELQRECGSALYFPVRRGGVCVALVMAAYRRGAEPFGAGQLRIARGVAHLASVALEHARILGELERASRLKSEFVAAISHELRTPLNIIIGYNDLLLDDAAAFGGEHAEMLARVGETARRLAALIDATLDLSKLESGTLRLDRGAVAIEDLVRQVEIETRELARRKPSVALRWVVGDAAVIDSDPAKLKIVLRNLIDNALKFTERGHVTVSVERRLDGVEFAVADTGVGIAPEALSYVFEAFRQGDASTTRRHDGVGLGLHLVQRWTELLGGTVTVTSTPGVGSTFRVWLPLRA